MFRTVSDNRDQLAEEITRLKLSSFRGLVALDGGDDEDEDDNSDDGSNEDGEDQGGSSGTGDDGKKDPVRDPKRRDASREAAKYRTRARDAEKRLAETEARLREIDDKDKSELEVAKRDLAELSARAEKAEARVAELEKRDAFFSSGAAALFVDPSVAIGLLDLKDIEPDDDGVFDLKTVRDRAEALLKVKPYLRATSGNDKDDDSSKEPSGRPANGPRGKNKNAPSDTLVKKFPALAGRV